ncbi:MAG: FHA domain-containing protein [Leisingera sp.]
MFKYKSPLSRLLEGAGKARETETEDIAPATEDSPENPQPIADFNALRAALGGGNLSADNYEETDELIPEEKMPDFAEGEAESEVEVPEEEALAEDQDADVEPEAPQPEDTQDDQVVTLRLTTEVPEAEAVEETPVAEVAAEEVIEVPEEPEVQPEPVVSQDPEPETEQVPEAEAAPAPEAQEPAVAPVANNDRRSRVKTTFLGFERADTHVQDLMETAEPVAKAEAAQETFPVGWLVVTNGPGRGSCITLTEGLMQIGRNDDQAIQLDFGDTGISRSNHAVIAYDPEDRKCYLGHGGKANLVRLNGKPVLSTVALSSGDLIRISETSIRFAAFCDDGFDWRDS